MSAKISIIVCTGARPEAFALCQKYLLRALTHWGGECQLILVDDGPTPTPCFLSHQLIRPDPLWSEGQNTHARNLVAGLDAVLHDRLLLIEDDDWYHADYVRLMSRMLDHFQLVGEGRARYYYVQSRATRQISNLKHASASQTGLRAEAYPMLRSQLSDYPYFDLRLWQQFAGKKHLLLGRNLVVGMKQMPGRENAGKLAYSLAGAQPDPKHVLLRQWVGVDADHYIAMGQPNRAVANNRQKELSQ